MHLNRRLICLDYTIFRISILDDLPRLERSFKEILKKVSMCLYSLSFRAKAATDRLCILGQVSELLGERHCLKDDLFFME